MFIVHKNQSNHNRIRFEGPPVNNLNHFEVVNAEKLLRPIKVLLISHSCQSATEGQPKAERLGIRSDVDLRVLAPDRWKHYGNWRNCDRPHSPSFTFQEAKVALPWAGPAQFYLHFYPDLANILRTFQPDVIDLWEEPWGLVSAQACYLRNRLLPSARIISETEQNINKRLPPPFEQFRAFTLRNADFVIGRNPESLQILRSKGYRGAAAVVSNGVDSDLFSRISSEERTQNRAQYGFKGFVVGYVGRLVPEKGLTDLIDALALCPADIDLVFVGDGPLRQELEERASSLGIASRVRFFAGRPQKDLAHIIASLDSLALVSWSTDRWMEQFGRVIIEAHSCGVPVIGSDSGAIPEVVGRGGIVIPERNVAALAVAMRSLATDSAKCKKYGEIGYKQAQYFFTWERVAARMSAIYSFVMQQRSPRLVHPWPTTDLEASLDNGPIEPLWLESQEVLSNFPGVAQT